MMISTMLEVGQTYSLIPLRECYFQISLDRCDFGHEFCKTLRQVLGRNSTSDMPPLRALLLRDRQDVRMRWSQPTSLHVEAGRGVRQPGGFWGLTLNLHAATIWDLEGINI